MQWHAIWWIFPLGCMAMMVVMFVFMAAIGGMRCAPWTRRMDRPRSREGAGHALDPPSPGSPSHSG